MAFSLCWWYSRVCKCNQFNLQKEHCMIFNRWSIQLISVFNINALKIHFELWPLALKWFEICSKLRRSSEQQQQTYCSTTHDQHFRLTMKLPQKCFHLYSMWSCTSSSVSTYWRISHGLQWTLKGILLSVTDVFAPLWVHMSLQANNAELLVPYLQDDTEAVHVSACIEKRD